MLILKVKSYSMAVTQMLPPFSWEKVNGQKLRARVDCTSESQTLTDIATASSKAKKVPVRDKNQKTYSSLKC